MIDLGHGELKERLTSFMGPTLLTEPWIQPPRRAKLVDIIRAYADLDQAVPINPAVGYVVPEGHWFQLEGIALAANVRQVGDNVSTEEAIAHLRMWQDDRARIICRLNNLEMQPGGSGHAYRDRRATLDPRNLGWKAYLNDITPLGNLSFSYPAQVINLPYVPAAWDTVAAPGTSPVFYRQTLRPRGTPTHGLQWIAPIRRLLRSGDRFEIALDLSDTDELCVPGGAAYGPNIFNDGGFNLWTTPNNLTDWNEFAVAASTVNQDAVAPFEPPFNVLLATDPGGTFVSVYQLPALNAGRNYRLRVQHMATPPGTFGTRSIVDQTTGNYLQLDFTWAPPPAYHNCAPSPAWNLETIDFTAPSTGPYDIRFIAQMHMNAEILFDIAELQEELPPVTCPINFRARIFGWVYPQTFLDYSAQGVQGE